MSSPSPDAVVGSHHPSEPDQSVAAEKFVEAANGQERDKGANEPVKKTVDWPLKGIREPHDNDVLFGRGGKWNHQLCRPPAKLLLDAIRPSHLPLTTCPCPQQAGPTITLETSAIERL